MPEKARVEPDSTGAEVSSQLDRPAHTQADALLALQSGAGNAAIWRALDAGRLPLAGAGPAGAAAALLQRQKVQTASGRYVGDIAGPTNNLREEVLSVMDRLHLMWELSNSDYGAEYPTITKEPPGSSVDKAKLPKTIAALKASETPAINPTVAKHFTGVPLKDAVGRGMANLKADVEAIQNALVADGNLAAGDHVTEKAAVSKAAAKVPDADIPKTIAGIGRMKTSIVAGTHRRDLYAGVKAVSASTKADVEAILTPGATVVGGVVVPPSAMTGKGPGGAFEAEMIATLKTSVKKWADRHRDLKKKPAAFPVASAHDIAHAAQKECERYFAPYVGAASRGVADVYHPGAYSLVAKLGDQSSRVLDDSYGASGRRGWSKYWMTLQGHGQNVLDKYKCVPTRSPDKAEFARTLEKFALDPGNRPDIDDAIRSWPAEAGTGTVFIQPYTAADPKALRTYRWDVFTTLIHEMMHVLAHPNFRDTATRVGGTGWKYLNEGLADVMRHDLWDGPGALKDRLGTAELAPLREKVEGGKYPYDPTVVKYHSDYGEYVQGKAIADKVGMPNAKAAFFLGQTELLGLGSGTASEQPLTGFADWAPTDAGDAGVYVVQPGDDFAKIMSKTKAPAGGVLKGGVALAAKTPIAPGDKLDVAGLTWVRAVTRDTLGTIAKQHNVPLADLAEANGLPAATVPTHAFAAGTRVMVPVHGSVGP